ncbi:MAG: OmpA family protein, partial [Verrucomicrobiales bacterium]|nr:OmpA family protein [Verrucomicrobiales bacterium]
TKKVSASANMKGDADAAGKELAELKKKLAAESKAHGEIKLKLTAAEKAAADAKKALEDQKKTCEGEKSKLTAEINKLRAEIEKLKAEIAGLKKAAMPSAAANLPKIDLPMLVNDPTTLDGKFFSLFQGLNQVKGGPGEREKVYAELTKDGNSKDIHLVPFQVGSAAVAGKEEQDLKAALNNTEKSARFLVVGYASTDGDAASNRKLSSQRASNVAQKISAISGVPQNQIKAIYFGQTTRFNANYLTPNRVVEVWRLK